MDYWTDCFCTKNHYYGLYCWYTKHIEASNMHGLLPLLLHFLFFDYVNSFCNKSNTTTASILRVDPDQRHIWSLDTVPHKLVKLWLIAQLLLG